MTPFEKTMLQEIGQLRGQVNFMMELLVKKFDISPEEFQKEIAAAYKQHGESPWDTYDKYSKSAD